MPHSEIHGSKGARPSPRLIAACHVLHRLSSPRHPSNALESLDRSSFAFMHGEDCAAIELITTHTASPRANALDDVLSPSCVSTDGACAHGRTLIHDVIEPPAHSRAATNLVSSIASWRQPSEAARWQPPALLRQGFGGHPSLRFAREGWWSRSGSNRRPEACKATALPTELRPP